MKNKKDVRVFDGVEYTLAKKFHFKPDANQYAEYLRDNGIPARVIKVFSTRKHRAYWKVYENYPK